MVRFDLRYNNEFSNWVVTVDGHNIGQSLSYTYFLSQTFDHSEFKEMLELRGIPCYDASHPPD